MCFGCHLSRLEKGIVTISHFDLNSGAKDKLREITDRLRQAGSEVVELEDNSDSEAIRSSMIGSKTSSQINVLGISAKHHIGIEPLFKQLRILYDTHSDGKFLYNEDVLTTQFGIDRFGRPCS